MTSTIDKLKELAKLTKVSEQEKQRSIETVKLLATPKGRISMALAIIESSKDCGREIAVRDAFSIIRCAFESADKGLAEERAGIVFAAVMEELKIQEALSALDTI